MKYCSIDIETSGLDSDKHKVLSIGIIIEDTEKKLPFDEIPKFHSIILQNEIIGSPYAINLNRNIISLMSDVIDNHELKSKYEFDYGVKFHREDEVVQEIYDFLYLNGYGDDMGLPSTCRFVNGKQLPVIGSSTKPIILNVAGKNFGTFDKKFLEKLPWWKKLITVRQRIIDPSTLYCDWLNDLTLPSLDECKNRASITGVVTHDALSDAWDVIQVLRKKY